MTPVQLEGLYLEYQQRFRVEFEFLLQQSSFAQVIFKNSELLFGDRSALFAATLENLFGCSFDGMGLGLSRVWDKRRDDTNLISIPNLVEGFSAQYFFGCFSLCEGREDRATFEILIADPLLGRLRTVRTEAMAHSIRVGASSDRNRSDIKGIREFNLVNGHVLSFCEQTARLMYSLNRQLDGTNWHGGKTYDDMMDDARRHHVAFLKYFVRDIVAS